MPTFAIVERATRQIVHLYEAEVATPEAFGGPMGWVEVSAHVMVPAELVGVAMEGLAAVPAAGGADDEADADAYTIVAAADAPVPVAEPVAPKPILKIAVVDFATDAIQHIYDAAEPNQKSFGGPWGWSDVTVHVAMPAGTDTEIVRPVRYEISQPAGEGGAQGYGYGWITEVTYRFETDPEKYAAKEARLWDMLRAKRNALLGECDWTQVADAPRGRCAAE